MVYIWMSKDMLQVLNKWTPLKIKEPAAEYCEFYF
jgi:hypothetical protein